MNEEFHGKIDEARNPGIDYDKYGKLLKGPMKDPWVRNLLAIVGLGLIGRLVYDVATRWINNL